MRRALPASPAASPQDSSRRRGRLARALLLAALAASPAGAPAPPAFAATTGAIRAIVTDANGAPVEGALLVVTDPTSATFRLETKTDKKGRADLIGLPPRDYRYRVEKAGFQSFESNFTAHAGDTEQAKVTLQAVAADATIEKNAAGEELVVEKKVDPWAVAFNEAVPLYKEDRDEEALARLDASLQAKPDYAPALLLKGVIEEEHGRCEEAIALLKQAHTIDPGASAALSPLIRCLDRTGRKDEAAGYRKVLAATGRSKTDLYNEAVTAINAGDDAAAAPLLEQALQQDANFAPALYQYGLVLFRRGDTAGALARLEGYLKIAPKGEFAEDARSLLQALKP